MIKRLNCLFLATLAVLLGSPVWAQGTVNNITTQVAKVYRPQADTIEVMSAKMGRGIKNVVVVPRQYDAGPQDERYPVLYLLHGAGGDYSNWPQKANLEDKATQFGVIIVCPDGQDSWYFDSPIDAKMQFETYLSQELIAYIDSHYRTFAVPAMRAITGLSMGGHGALWLALRHPEVYGSCGSMSGGVDITHFPHKWKLDQRLGQWESNGARWAQHSVMSLVPHAKPGQNIIIDDGVDDIFYAENCALHDALLKAGIPHDFTIRPGNHSWSYWLNSLDYHLLFFSKAFAQSSLQTKQQ